MSEEPVIGAESAQDDDAGAHDEPVIGPTDDTDASEAELAGLLRETLLAAHDDLSPEDLAGETVEAVREQYVSARARLEREAAEATAARVPAGSPGRFAPEPASAFEKIREGLTRLNA